MQFEKSSFDDILEIEISKEISNFAVKYGGKNNFEKQKCLFDLFNLKVPNNGYTKLKASSYFDEIFKKMPSEMLSDDTDYEGMFLDSWRTEIPALSVLTAEPVIQDGMPCWYVVYQIRSETDFYTLITKFWEHRSPQNSFFKSSLD